MSLDILIVDDNVAMRKMFVKTLKLSGLDLGEVYQAENGQEGLKQLSNRRVDLLLIDFNMPVMDGMEMLHRVKSNSQTHDIPALIISKESNEERIAAFYKLGASFLHKPFSPEQLIEEIHIVLGMAN